MENLDFFVREDLFENGTNEDGFPMESSKFYIVAEDNSGRRFALVGSDLFNDEISNEKIIGIQEKRIKKIKSSISSGQDLNMDCWIEIDPSYGSNAYSKKEATGYFKLREMEEERA